MKDVFILLAVAMVALVLLTTAWCLMGVVLAAIWSFAIVAIWPTLPVIAWWQFSLIAIGLSCVGKLLASR